MTGLVRGARRRVGGQVGVSDRLRRPARAGPDGPGRAHRCVAHLPRPADLEPIGAEWPDEGRAFPVIFWVYLVAAGLVAAGYADFALIAYHFVYRQAVPTDWVSVLYALAMGVQGVAALAFGRLFDRYGMSVLIASVLLSAPFAPLSSQYGRIGAFSG